QAFPFGVEAIGYITHAAPPAAARTARFTATRASWIFCWLLPRLRDAETAASAAAPAVAWVTALPAKGCAPSFETQGIGATCPSTMRALLTVLPFMFRATAAVA